MFLDAEWVQLRGTGRDAPRSFYTSPEAERLQKATCGALRDAATSIYELCYDGAQIFNFVNYGVGVVGLRCARVSCVALAAAAELAHAVANHRCPFPPPSTEQMRRRAAGAEGEGQECARNRAHAGPR